MNWQEKDRTGKTSYVVITAPEWGLMPGSWGRGETSFSDSVVTGSKKPAR